MQGRNGEPKYPVKSLEKSLAILKLLTQTGKDLSITEMGKSLSLGKGTIHRMLDTLKAHQFVRQDPHSLKYGLGLCAFEMASTFQKEAFLRKIVSLPLKKLSENCREAISASILEHNEVRYIARFESREALRVSIGEGTRFPAHCTATGKILLSSFSDDYLERLYDRKGLLAALTANSITSRKKLFEALQTVRREGVAFDLEEALLGVNCVARPIRDTKNEVVAAISISGPISRMTPDKMQELSALLLVTARQISKELGHGESAQPERAKKTKAASFPGK